MIPYCLPVSRISTVTQSKTELTFLLVANKLSNSNNVMCAYSVQLLVRRLPLVRILHMMVEYKRAKVSKYRYKGIKHHAGSLSLYK